MLDAYRFELLPKVSQSAKKQFMRYSYLARHQCATLVVCLDLGQLLVVIHEELEVLVGHIDFGIAALFSVFLKGLLASREGIPIELSILSLCQCICVTHLLILFLISFDLSFMKMAEVLSLADIFDPGPCKASKKRMWMSDGLA